MGLRLRTEMPEIKGITKWFLKEIKKEDLLGKPTLINFWSVSCSLCKESMPELNDMVDNIKELNVVGIHMPRSEKDTDINEVKKVVEKYKLKYPQGVDNQHDVVDAFQNEFVPAFFLFDSKGLLRHRSAGEKALSMLKTPLERVLDEYKQGE